MNFVIVYRSFNLCVYLKTGIVDVGETEGESRISKPKFLPRCSCTDKASKPVHVVKVRIS